MSQATRFRIRGQEICLQSWDTLKYTRCNSTENFIAKKCKDNIWNEFIGCINIVELVYRRRGILGHSFIFTSPQTALNKLRGAENWTMRNLQLQLQIACWPLKRYSISAITYALWQNNICKMRRVRCLHMQVHVPHGQPPPPQCG